MMTSLHAARVRRTTCRQNAFVISFMVVAAAMLIAPTVQAQNQVVTDPVGFTSVVIDPGATSALSLPVNNLPDYHGVVSVLSANTIQTAYAGWSTSAYGPFSSNPHVIRVLSGASKGRHFKVASNTADTLTFITGAGDLTT